jgi:hypothetical protein
MLRRVGPKQGSASQDRTEHKKQTENVYVSNGIRTHDPCAGAIEDSEATVFSFKTFHKQF